MAKTAKTARRSSSEGKPRVVAVPVAATSARPSARGTKDRRDRVVSTSKSAASATSSAPTRALPNPDDVPRDLDLLMRENVAHLRDLQKSIAVRGDGEHDSTVKNTARISVALTTACAELRQIRKAAHREISRIPLEAIVSYLRTLTEVERQQVALDVSGTSDEEPLL